MSLGDFSIGPARLRLMSDVQSIELEPPSKKQPELAIVRVFELELDGMSGIELGDAVFRNGERDLRVLRRGAVDALDPIVGRMRLGVREERENRLSVRLRIPAPNERGNITPHKTTLEELDDATGIDVRGTLLAFGARAVTTRALALADEGRGRNDLCVVFDRETDFLPAAVYAITPVLVYWKQFATP